MHGAKMFQSLRFPWKFSGNPFSDVKPLPTPLEMSLESSKQGFEYAIKQTVEGMILRDFAFLKSIMEETLYSEIEEGLNILGRRGHHLKFVNNDLSPCMCFFNEQVYKGVQIDRQKNTGKTAWSLPSLQVPNVPLENFKVFSGPENNLIFRLDVIYSSKRKLVIVDEKDQIVIGNDRKIKQSHKFTFECFAHYNNGLLTSTKVLYQMMRYFAFAKGTPPLDFTNWFITDIDDFLSGNPIVN